MAAAEQFLEQQMHPTVIIRQYKEALDDIISLLEGPLSIPVDKSDKTAIANVVKACIGTKFISKWSDMAVNIALDAVNTVMLEENGRTEVDLKRYAKVEKIPGGSVEESQILRGVMINKDVTHPKMKRYIKVFIVKICSLNHNCMICLCRILELCCWIVLWSTRKENLKPTLKSLVKK